MWARQVILAVIGLSSGIAVAGGLFSFIIGLGVVSDFADRTHTGANVILYEEMIALGGFCAGIFVGCWSMALAEILNIFPIFIRRVKLLRGVPYIILSMAIGKGIGALLFFLKGW